MQMIGGVGNAALWAHLAWVFLKWFGVWSAFWIVVILVNYWHTRGKGYDR